MDAIATNNDQPDQAGGSREPIDFKFRWVERPESTVVGRMRENGQINEHELVLNDLSYLQQSISEAVLVEDQLFASVETAEDESIVLTIQIHDNKGPDVLCFINVDLSKRKARDRIDHLSERQSNENQGQVLVREVICPHCQATNVLEGKATPQYYCEYCETIISELESEDLLDLEKNYCICERCQMYSRPQNFTVFFFYFLMYFGGIHHKKIKCCPACFRKTAWMMLLGNLPFLLGVPFAIYALHRCYYGTVRTGVFRGLHEANSFLRRGRTDQALAKYEEILEQHPLSAGVKYNIAVGLIQQNDTAHATQMLELALEDCGNYRPAQERIVEILLSQGEVPAAHALMEKFCFDETLKQELIIQSTADETDLYLDQFQDDPQEETAD